ncbi:hypothetical protein [Mailhella massiliensis]|uniref:Phage tail tape measure protein n=1 Tax=Mailhella massiliensis TaxID=1903261 RepID=A0A921AX73_9BACT|nr:hypothetical protein [Mailhella massiliensis]HJD97492.1 hypothetical protein [Mailhella massiliensis]
MAKNKVSIDFVIGAYDKFSAGFAKFNAKLESATGAVSRMQAQVSRFSQRSGLSKVAGAAGDVADAVAGIGDGAMESLDRLTGALGKMTLLLGGASGGMLALASATAEQAQAAERSAVALGVNAKDLQKLQYAASTVNVEAENMTDILSDLTEKMVEAGDSDDLAAMFKALGVSVKNADGTMKNSAQVLMEIADAFSGMQDGAVKTKLAIELMGDEGRKLIPVLNKGASGLRELGKEAEQAGMVFDDTARSDARRFQESLSGVGNQVAGLRNAIGRQLMPVFTPIMEKFEGWLRLNKGLVAVETGEWVQKIADNIPAFLDGAERWLSTGGKVLGWCTDFIDRTIGMENALKLVALYMGTPFIRSLFNAGKAVAGFGLALSTNPIGAFITAIGLLVAAGWWLYNNWEEISAGMKKFCTEIKNAVQGVADVQDAADLHGIDLEDTDALMDPENARILAEAAKGGSREAQAEPSMPESTTSGFSDLARSGTVSSETVRKEEKEVTHKVELIVPAGMEARVDRQASDAVTVKRDNMGYGWAFAGV